MKWAIAATVVLAAAFSGCLLRSQAKECEYDGLPAKCGELLVHLSKNYRTGDLHPFTGDLRNLISKEGGRIVTDSADLGIIVAKFDSDEEKLARVLNRLRRHPAVRSVDYNWISVPNGGLPVD